MISEALEREIQELKRENMLLKAELAQLKKMIFDARRERFVADQDPKQGVLFAGQASQEEAGLIEVEQEARRPSKKKKLKRIVTRNTFPDSLPRITEVIEPEGVELEQTIQIGEDITETLGYIPGSLHVKQLIRPRRVIKGKEDEGVRQASIPPRLIPRGMVDESLVAHLIIEKILFHTPVHRFRKKLKQAGVGFISEQNLYNWFHAAAAQLIPLCDLFKADLLSQDYLQCDETRIQVLSKNKPGASIRGQMWGIYQPQLQAVFFEYHPSRSTNAAQALLKGFEGTLQVDGYTSYETLAKRSPIELIYCMAHVRRKFFEAQNTDPPRAEYFLRQVQQLYQVERQARQNKLTHEQRYAVRQEKSLPILEHLEQWLKDQLVSAEVLPQSPIGKAIAYALPRWQGLCTYAHDGRFEIDNNLVENCIRPVALGRKNYLFAGSDEYAEHLAYLYAIIGTADKYGLNMQRYLTWLLRQVASCKITSGALEWLPHRMTQQKLNDFRD
jgi:transposase